MKVMEDLQQSHFAYVCLKSPSAKPLRPDAQAAILEALAAAAASAAAAAAEAEDKGPDSEGADPGTTHGCNAGGSEA